MLGRVRSKVFSLADRLQSDQLSIKGSSFVTGFWRSGTTWMMSAISEAIRGKSVFEPFHWKVEEYLDLIGESVHPPINRRSYLKAYMPYCADFREEDKLWKFLQNTMVGGIQNEWIHRGRSILFPASGRTVVKLVRGQLMQPAFQGGNLPALIHIRRDPRAVLASLLRHDWAWWMQTLSLKDQLLCPEDGRAEYFSQWEREIERADQKEFPIRAITYWALTERFVIDRGLPKPEDVLVCYESACLEQAEYLNQELNHTLPTGCSIEARHLYEESPTTQNGRSKIIKKRIFGWKEELTTNQIEDVKSIAWHFGLEDALFK